MTNPIDLQIGDALNTAGVTAKQALGDEVRKIDFRSYFLQDNKKLERRQWSLWEPIYIRQARFMLYYDYQQTLLRPPGRKGYISQAVEERDKVWMFNLVKRHTDEVSSLWLSVAPKTDFALRDEDLENEQTKLDAFNAFNDFCNLEHLTPLYVQELSKHAVGFGCYYAESWFDPNSGKGIEIEPEFENVGSPGYTTTMCRVCNNVQPGAADACSQCQSPLVQQVQVPEVNGSVMKGFRKVAKGEIEDQLRLACQIRYSLVTGFERSSYMYIEDERLKEQVQKEYGFKSVQKAQSRLQYDDLIYPIRMLRQAERGEFNAILSRDDDDEGVLEQRFFRQPELLHYLQLDKPYDAPGFGQIPANVRLSEVFPEGMMLKQVKGGDEFLQVGEQDYCKRFTQGQFSTTPGRSDPQGAKELPEMNKVGNMLKSGLLVHLLKFLNPAIAVVDEVFGKERLFNRQDPVVRVSAAKLAAFQTGLPGAMANIAPPPMNQAMFPAIQMLDSATQDAGHAQTQDSADPNVDSSTATAWKIGEGRFTRNAGMYMTAFGEFIVKHFKNIKLELARENYGDIRQVAGSDEDGNRVSRILKKVDLQSEVIVSIRQESLQPNLKLEKRENAKEAGQLVIELVKNGIAITPGVERTINKAYNTDIQFNEEDERIEEAEEGLEMAREQLPTVAMMDPQSGALQLYMMNPVDASRLGHEEQAWWWRNWLSSGAGRKAEPVLQILANMYIDAHCAAIMNEGQFAPARAQAGMALVKNLAVAPPPPMMPGAMPGPGAPEGQAPGGAAGQGAGVPPDAPGQLPPQGGGIPGSGQTMPTTGLPAEQMPRLGMPYETAVAGA